MHKLAVSSLTVVLLGLTVGIAGCSSSSNSSNPPGSQAQKSAFCGGNITIDKASANTTSESGFLAILKANQAALTAMKDNLPSGSLGTEASGLVNAAEQAISQNSTNPLNNAPSTAGADIDTYCGVDGSGSPLPSYFASGKNSTFCTTFAPIYSDVSNASDVNGVLQALTADKAQVDQLSTLVSGLPSSIQSDASNMVSQAQTAISSNSTSSLQTGQGYFMDVSLYCGQNS